MEILIVVQVLILVAYLRETVTAMMIVLDISSVELTIAIVLFHLIVTAAMTLQQARIF